MSDVFLSYASPDRDAARKIADLLTGQGWSVWWDRTIPVGRAWDDVIEQQLEAAVCVVVLWSKASVASSWVKSEAAEGMRRGVLVPAMLDDIKIPLEFRRLQAADLSQWRTAVAPSELGRLFDSIASHVARPVPAATPPLPPPPVPTPTPTPAPTPIPALDRASARPGVADARSTPLPAWFTWPRAAGAAAVAAVLVAGILIKGQPPSDSTPAPQTEARQPPQTTAQPSPTTVAQQAPPAAQTAQTKPANADANANANANAAATRVPPRALEQPPSSTAAPAAELPAPGPAAVDPAPSPVPTPPSTQDPIRVGVLHSLSGTMAITEAALKDTILMAIDEANARGGLLGRKLEAVVVDPASNWPLFAKKARQLISDDKVSVMFGGYTSVSRKSMLPVVEELNGLLFFPAQHEGEEISNNVFYTGAVPNQQAIPAAQYLMGKAGGGARRFVLLGTDYVFPRITNKILRAYLDSQGVGSADIVEQYVPFGHSDYQSLVAKIKQFAGAGIRTAVISTINGDSNTAFYKELGAQDIVPADVPVLALSVGEEELRGVDAKPLLGQLAAWNYFMSIQSPANAAFVRKWAAYAKAKGVPGHKDMPLTNDAMEASYIGFNMWLQAVTKAKSTDTDKVIAAMADQTFAAPSGVVAVMDARNHHLQRAAFVGALRPDRQFYVLWSSPGPIKAQPWNPLLPANRGKKDEPSVR